MSPTSCDNTLPTRPLLTTKEHGPLGAASEFSSLRLWVLVFFYEGMDETEDRQATYSSCTSLRHPTLETTVLVNSAALRCATSIFFADAFLYHSSREATGGSWDDHPREAFLLQCPLAEAVGEASK